MDDDEYDDPCEPLPSAWCCKYEAHAPHVYLALNTETYRCPGVTQDALNELSARLSVTCEHGMSASLCAGPNHYPSDH